MTTMRATSAEHHPDDYAIWPNGTYATLDEVRRVEFDWMSDDYEIVAAENHARLIYLGLEDLVLEETG